MTAPPMLSESVTLKRFNRTRGKKTQRPEGWFFGVSSWFEGGRVALIMWEDSRTSQYHSRKALHGGRTEQLSKKKKNQKALWLPGFGRAKVRIPGASRTPP